MDEEELNAWEEMEEDRVNTTAPTSHQTDPSHQGSCKFDGLHVMVMPIHRQGRQVSPVVGPDEDDWAECCRCGRVEDSAGRPVLDPPFERCAR
jgi:hypothetical protein